MRKLSTLLCILMPLMLTAQQAMMQLDNIPGDKEVSVTNWVPVVISVVGDILAIQPYTNRVHAIEARTNAWNTAFGWGNHHQQGYATTQDVAQAIANIPPVVIPDETDPRAMKLYHYGDPDIVITSAGDFGFDAGSGTITAYTGTDEDIVLPYEINGVPVVAIGSNAFISNQVIKTLKAPKTLTSIGDNAFAYSSLTSLVAPALTTIGGFAFSGNPLISLNAPALTHIGGFAFSGSSLTSLVVPAVTLIGDYAFAYSSLTTIYYGGNQPTAGEDIYDGTPANLVSYVTDPTATGWGETFGGRPVVRLPLYADEVHIGGELAATQPYVNDAIANIPASIYTPIKPTTAALAITSTNDIYRITTSTAVTVTPDLSELTPIPANKIARWEVWLDCTGTNALDSTWDSAFDWSGSEPDLTVTGCYKFACSVVSGGKISIKQTYPSVYKWQSCPVSTPAVTESFKSAGESAYIHSRFVAGGSSGITWLVAERLNTAPSLFSIPGGNFAFTNGTPVEVYSSDYYNEGSLEASFNSRGNDYETVAITTTPRSPSYSSNTFLTIVYRGDMKGNRLISVTTRPMNELEIKAYEAGWRP